MSTPRDRATLELRFGIAGRLSFDLGRGDLPRARLVTGDAVAEVYLHGAHVTDLRLGGAPVLFLARGARFGPGSSIRGGVPVCHPWFGAHPDDPAAPSHGLARTADWEVRASAARGEGVELALGGTFGGFDTTLTVALGDHLSLTLDAVNATGAPARLEGALHSYFRVSDVRDVSLEGLESRPYLDQLEGRARRQGGAEPLRFNGETDRIYLGTTAARRLVDPGLDRAILVSTTGARSTVVWNPWVEKTARMSDLADDEWPRFLCVETGNVADDALLLEPGATHRLVTKITVEPM